MKKFLAGLLALAMTVSMFAMTAFATELTEQDESVTSASTINASREGSITIHKYKHVYDLEMGWNGLITGEKVDNVPDGARTLDGVEFTIYKIVGKEDLLKYYSGVEGDESAIQLPTNHQLSSTDTNINDKVCVRDEKGRNYVLNEVGPCKDAVKIGEPLTTGKGGQNPGEVKFENLEVGIYLVIETNSPDSVLVPTTPFLVSVPMTVSHRNEEGKVTESEWIYDVHVYPKNDTTSSGPVKLWKVDGEKNGIGGAKFQLEKYESDGWKAIDETTDQYGVVHTVGENCVVNGEELTGVLTSDSATGVVEVDNLAPGVYRFVELDAPNGFIQVKGAWYFEIYSDNGAIGWMTNSYPFGDYKDGFISSIDAINQNNFNKPPTIVQAQSTSRPEGGEAYAVNIKPDIEKEVVPKDTPKVEKPTYPDNPDWGSYYDYETYAKEANYSAGDEIPFRLTINFPTSNYKGLETAMIYDQPTNMKVDMESFELWYLDDTTNTPIEVTWLDDEFSPVEDGDGFRIDLLPLKEQGYTEFYIKYTATLKTDAEVTSTSGNPNVVTLEYSNSYKGTGTNKITDRAVVYSGEIAVYKTDGTTGLGGVEFELYEQQDATIKPGDKIGEGDKQKTTLTSAQAIEKGLDNPTSTAYVQIGGTYTTDSDGNVSMKGLSDGTYWLVETKARDGYNLLERPVEVPLYCVNEETHTTTFTTDADFSPIESEDGTVTGYSFNKNVISQTFTENSAIITGESAKIGVSKTVINRQGFTLPTTGGMGTFLFTFVGVAMMAAAVILFFTSKKKEAK